MYGKETNTIEINCKKLNYIENSCRHKYNAAVLKAIRQYTTTMTARRISCFSHKQLSRFSKTWILRPKYDRRRMVVRSCPDGLYMFTYVPSWYYIVRVDYRYFISDQSKVKDRMCEGGHTNKRTLITNTDQAQYTRVSILSWNEFQFSLTATPVNSSFKSDRSLHKSSNSPTTAEQDRYHFEHR